MAHPSLFYIKFLVAKGWPNGENPTTVNAVLDEYGLPRVSDDEFDRIAAGLHPPKNFSPLNKNHAATATFMREEKIYSMWKPGKDDLGAIIELIWKPQIRETVQLLLCGRIPSDEIVTRIEKKHNKKLLARTVDLYAHYFWNTPMTSNEEWSKLLYGNFMRDHYFAALWGSRNQALYRAGFSPTIDGKKALKEAHRSLYMRLEASRILPDTKDTAGIVGRLAKEMVVVHMALFGEGAGVEESMRELRKFKMERKADNVVPINRLAPAGNFTGSGVARKDKRNDD